MTRPTDQRRRPVPQTGQDRKPPVVAIALGALAVVVLLGVVVAVTRSGGDESASGTDALGFGTLTVEGDPLPEHTGRPIHRRDSRSGARRPGPRRVQDLGRRSRRAHGRHPRPLVAPMPGRAPRLVDLADGDDAEGVRMVVVLTGSSADAPNFPPADWLDDEGWTGDVLVDDERYTAASAYGLSATVPRCAG